VGGCLLQRGGDNLIFQAHKKNAGNKGKPQAQLLTTDLLPIHAMLTTKK
jgi:hypothetical protein